MEGTGICRKINYIWDALQDEESKILMDARLQYSISKDRFQFYKAVDGLVHQWYCSELVQFLKTYNGKGIIIWGCGFDGRETKRVLDICHCSPSYFCDSDNSKVGSKVDGVLVISVDELIEKYSDYAVVIGSGKYKDEINEALLSHNFSTANILYPSYGHLQAVSDKCQYFDVFKPEDSEVFVDAGAYDGGTIEEFIKWTGGKYERVIALEPLNDMCSHIEERCKTEGWHNIDLQEVAAWNKEESLFFEEERAGSKIDENGTISVRGMDIDRIVEGKRVTFIKMDIEGSERKALEGARNAIQKYRPKLAISLYHKPEDIVELPAYILELVPEYKFYIRHYRSDVCETVLYAVI